MNAPVKLSRTVNMTDTKPAAVEVRGLAKHYGSVVALRDVNLRIAAGEYFVLLGPSGGGKTTLLRTIGGFHKPTRGSVLLHGEEVGHLPPDKRPTSMVFQSYALFPHMTVMQNVGYGLKIKGLSKSENQDRSAAALDLVGLTGLSERKPHELSGGQQQRVQLARAMVLERDILLLDEPLAALDAQLRKDMCLELKHLQEKVGITFIHVTHNQEEAMTVADRIALIADGDLVEHGHARDIYVAPERTFTASFVGENNMLSGTVTKATKTSVSVDIGTGDPLVAETRGQKVAVGDKVSLSIRSELVKMTKGTAKTGTKAGHTLTGAYHEAVYLGLTTSHMITLPTGQDMVSRVVEDTAEPPKSGAPVRLSWKPGSLRLHVN
jgi:ABC-type Fe3+/spermidine/putrescine transport system ATPase subunit